MSTSHTLNTRSEYCYMLAPIHITLLNSTSHFANSNIITDNSNSSATICTSHSLLTNTMLAALMPSSCVETSLS